MAAVLADTVTQSEHIILLMLAVGGVFILVIAVGETLHWLNNRRKARRRARRPVY
jgi:uncharacterized membrane protein YidH (DUF202 family)